MNNKREIMTYTGKMFDFFEPKPESICVEDIAHHLACINRYTGATRKPYSVAEHCVRASYLPVGDPLLILMHDSAEAYINDIATPQKNGLMWQFNWGGFRVSYKQVEAEILRTIGKALGIPKLASWLVMPKEVEDADRVMFVTEARDLMPPQGVKVFRDLGWIPAGIEPLAEKIIPWYWKAAEFRFLYRFEELMKCG